MMGIQRASEDVLKPEIHAFTLSFGAPLEREFMDDYLKKSLGQVRLTLIIGTLL